ncbi:mediator of RNA polymerase II transcription subunit 14 isoform X2 [Aethina tumida]|uniref:mediator of RNA polymerase II transcription subunit 14 isoform X2 n=1 Tax=Aethina tumida TaxID=116153 RepID=UPI00214803DB|nr:mediator of RNA polymerase II transcription subunit 14 isoform X2 [Aethina tumida]
MAPVPLEGLQNPVANAVAQGGLGGPQEGNRGGMISLAMLIDFIVQRTYHELTVLAELLPRKTDMERKIEIYNFSTRTRQLFVRLLALVKWANSASKVEKSARIMGFLDKQSLLFVETADMLARMARETLVQARLPNFHIPAAVEVLTTGTYGRLPACIREKIVPPDPITAVEKRNTLLKLNQVIQNRLVSGNLLPQMKNCKIENGRVIFNVQHEFEVSLTVMGDGPNIPWRLLEIDILVEDKETGDGKALVHSLQVQYIHQLIQSRLVDNSQPLAEVYNCLHFFCQSLQLEVLYSQTLRLMRDRLDDHIHVDEYIPGKSLTVSYWRELTIKGKELANKDLRSELGYRLTVQVDVHDPARPLAVLHVPSLGNKECEIADRAIRSEILSMERLLVHTIYVRTKSRLTDIKLELQEMLKDVECNLQGLPAILSVAVLQPCLRAEQLLITVDTHTGMLQCHVPQYDPPLVPELNNALNGDHSKLPMLISELRFWITQRRCEKTLQHLPATAYERLPLMHTADHEINHIGKHRMYVQLHRHPNVVLVIEFKEKPNSPCEIDCLFHIVVVRHSSVEENPNDESIESEIPKVYLKVQTVIEFDTFVATHGPFTNVDGSCDSDHTEPNSLKRKGGIKVESATRRSKQPAYFVSELAHVVAMCDERLPYVSLAKELTNRNVFHQGVQVEANATGLVLKFIQLPPPTAEIGQSAAWHALLKRLLSASVRVLIKGVLKSWLVEFVFYSTPLSSTHPKEQGSRRPIYFQYDMATIDNTSKTVDSLLNDWSQIVHLYTIVHDLSEYLKIDKYSFLANMFCIKSYNYSKLILCYGPDKGAMVSVTWNSIEKVFKLAFGATNNALNAHSIVQEQLESHLNEHRNLAQIVQLLHETYEPLLSISKLPTIPQLGVHNTRPQVPVQTFTIMAQSCSLIRLSYQGMYCLELRILGSGLVSLRDGAYSRFDRSNVVDVFTPTQGLKTFLSKYVDESAVFRRRSQSEDDNPPSPMEVEGSFLSPRDTGLRFHHPPQTPPSGSNPHTPASPHTATGGMSSHNFGSSPATTFSLASPTSLTTNINPSPMPHPSPGSGLVANSPLNPQLASPGGLLSNSSPGPASTNMPGHSPVSSYLPSGHNDGSPFPSQSMASPAASNWPGSPGMPRPSPARPGQSPGGGPVMHSPQSASADLKQGGGGAAGVGHLARVLPQRSWAGAVPTVLTHEALETLCCPSPHPQGFPGPELAPLERFLGCVYMRRQLQRFINSEAYLTVIQNTEPGVIHFKVGEIFQCRIGLNTQHLQSLHLKITPLQDHKDVWSQEDLQILEKFFDTRAATPPYKPTSMFTFCNMLNVPVNVLKDFIQIMRLELMPGLVQQQGMKWSVQWMLRIPPSATPIVPTGMSGVLAIRNKILFFLQVSRIGVQYPVNMEPPSIVLPCIYDIGTNVTSLAEKREMGSVPALQAASQILKQFGHFQANLAECSVFPAIREMLLNLTLPSEPQQQSPAAPVQQIQSPAMQMAQTGQPGGYMPMMMGPQ